MKFKELDNIDDISKRFVERFIMSWEEFQIKQKDFIDDLRTRNGNLNILLTLTDNLYTKNA